MRIAILTSGILPVPAVQGGAVENLVDFYLDYNNMHKLHDITIYSIWHPDVKIHPSLKSDVNHYIYIKVNSWWAKFKKKCYQMTHGSEYYHYTIEYFLEQALKDINKYHYDLIIIENRPGYAIKLKSKTAAKIIYHLHNDLLNKEDMYSTEIYELASRIITVSDYIKSRISLINPSDEKCVTVYNGIDIHAFSKDIAPAHIDSITVNDFIIVFSGRVNKEKGILELISAMNNIEKSYPIKLLVLGSSFYGNATNEDSFFFKLKEMAEPIKDRIIFTGFIPYTEMPNYLKMADIAIIPSNWDDPFPTTVLEAQAMGLPIITTRRGGIPEEVSDDNSILLETDEKFVDNLTKAILHLYDHPEERRRMSVASLERSKEFDRDTYARNFFNAVEY